MPAPESVRSLQDDEGVNDQAGLVSDSPETRRILELIQPALLAQGYEVVRLTFTGGGRPVLQLMIDRSDSQTVTVDDCTTASRALSVLLDTEDPIAGSYELEVSSPGIDRPLTRAKDFERFVGLEAKIELKSPVAGRRRFRGRLAGLVDDAIRIELGDGDAPGEEGCVDLPFALVQKAKLVLTDELLSAHAGAAKHENAS